MKKVGIVGGLGPESTVDYYRSLVTRYRERVRDGSYPRIIINSIDLKRIIDGMGAGDLAGVAADLIDGVQDLAGAGADFGLIAANTPHAVFDQVASRSPIPLLSIVEAACAAAKADGHKRLGLFGARFTMQGTFYADVFGPAGIALVTPEPDEQEWIHEKYMGELVNGVFLPETRTRLLAIVDRLVERHSIDGLLLAGTELPLILEEDSYNAIPLLDTTAIHVERAIDELLR